MSKYPLHEDFADVPDTKRGIEAKFLYYFVNIIVRAQAKKIKADGIKVTETHKKVPGYKGEMIKVRIYSPVEAEDNLPCIVYYHGGGWVGDLLPNQVNYGIYLAEHVKCKVVTVEYRLALKHPFPVGLEDSYAAFQWVCENAHELGIDPNRIAVFGDSAGGNLATNMCLMARDRGGHMPCFQMLLYPGVDATCSTESAKKYVDTPQINSYGVKYSWKMYLANGDCGMNSLVSPLFAEDHSGLPEAYVETAEFDPVHDEGIAYAEKLKNAGVEVELYETKGTYHGFDINMDAPYSKAALARRAEKFRSVFEINK